MREFLVEISSRHNDVETTIILLATLLSIVVIIGVLINLISINKKKSSTPVVEGDPWDPFNPAYDRDFHGELKSQNTWGRNVKKGDQYWDPNLISWRKKL